MYIIEKGATIMGKEIFISSQQQDLDNSSSLDQSYYIEEEFELPLDIARKGDQLTIKAPVIGATPTDIKLTIDNNIINIRKEPTLDNDNFDNYYIKECHWGSISRSIRLPVSVDYQKAVAHLNNGILTIAIPIINKKRHKPIKIN